MLLSRSPTLRTQTVCASHYQKYRRRANTRVLKVTNWTFTSIPQNNHGRITPASGERLCYHVSYSAIPLCQGRGAGSIFPLCCTPFLLPLLCDLFSDFLPDLRYVSVIRSIGGMPAKTMSPDIVRYADATRNAIHLWHCFIILNTYFYTIQERRIAVLSVEQLLTASLYDALGLPCLVWFFSVTLSFRRPFWRLIMCETRSWFFDSYRRPGTWRSGTILSVVLWSSLPTCCVSFFLVRMISSAFCDASSISMSNVHYMYDILINKLIHWRRKPNRRPPDQNADPVLLPPSLKLKSKNL